MPYLRVANVYADKLALEDVQVIGVNESEIERVLLKQHDLLIVEGNGSPDQVGRAAIWNGSITPCLHQNHLIKARFTNVTVVEYVRYWLLSTDGRDTVMRVASSTSGLYTLSLSKVSELAIPLAPLNEQHRIVAAFHNHSRPAALSINCGVRWDKGQQRNLLPLKIIIYLALLAVDKNRLLLFKCKIKVMQNRLFV